MQSDSATMAVAFTDPPTLEANVVSIGPSASPACRFMALAFNPNGPGAVWDTATWSDGTGTDFWYGAGQWEDITGRVRGLTWKRGCESPLDRPKVGTATITLDNQDGQVSPWAGGTLTWIEPGVFVHFGVLAGDDPLAMTWLPFFTGEVESLTESTAEFVDSWVDIALSETTALLGAFNGSQQSAIGTGDTLTQRIARLLADAEWPAGYVVDTDSVGDLATYQATAMAQNRLAELYLVGDSAGMRVLAGSDGRLRVTSPYPAPDVSADNAFSNYPTGTELPVVNIKPYSSTDRVVNVAIASRAGGVEQSSIDPVSIRRYGRFDPGGSRNDLIVQTDTQVLAMLERIVLNAANDALGISSIDLDADQDPVNLPYIMAVIASSSLEVRTPIDLRWVHPSGNILHIALMVDGMSHNITPVQPGVAVRWTCTLSTTTRIVGSSGIWDTALFDIDYFSALEAI